MLTRNDFCFGSGLCVRSLFWFTRLTAVKLITITWLLTLLCSCTWLNTLSTPKPQELEALLEQRHYNEVLAVVEKQLARPLDAEQQSYWQAISKRATIEAAAFQQEQLPRLKRLARRNEWSKANVEQVFLQQHLPANDLLSELFTDVNNQRQQHIDSLTRSLAKLEAKHLPQTLRLYERLFKADPDDASALSRWQQERDKRDRLMVTVKAYAAMAEAEQEYGLALEYLRSIQRLEDSLVILSQIKRLRSLLAEQQKAQIARSNNSELSNRQQEQRLNYNTAINQQQWLEAKAILLAMLKQRPGDKALLDEQQRLADSLVIEVARATALGEAYYSEGNIEYALTAWQAALPLAPSDAQLLANIERAQRILDKVKTLKEGGSNGNR